MEKPKKPLTEQQITHVMRAVGISYIYDQGIKDLFGKKREELCLFVQSMLSDYAPDSSETQKAFAEVQKYYESIFTPTPKNPDPMYKLFNNGKLANEIHFRQSMVPNPIDVTRFFTYFARGAQFIADEYGANPPIEKIMVVSPELFEKIRKKKARNPNDNMMSYMTESTYQPSPGTKPITIKNTLLVNAAFIYQSVVYRANNLAIIMGGSETGKKMGYLFYDDHLTNGGIEECDHAHLLANPEAFHQKCGITLEEYMKSRADTKSVNYNKDPLEIHADAMKEKAAKQFKYQAPRLA